MVTLVALTGEQQRPIPVVQRGVSAERNRIHGVILLAVRAPKEFPRSRDMECHIALEFDCADLESAGRNQHRPASILMACIDRRLQRGGIECNAIAFRAILANVVDAGAGIVVVMLRQLESKPSL